MDQQFGGWLRASVTLPKKCSVVKVEGFEKEEMRDDRLHTVALNSNNKVRNVANGNFLIRSDVVSIGPERSEGVHEDGMDMSEPLGEKPNNYNGDFQEILNEIDTGLAKFDDCSSSDPPLGTMTSSYPSLGTMIGLVLPS